MQEKENSKNQLYYGDNLEVMRKFVKDESVDLCYIDPPFNSKRNYNQIYNNIGKEDTAQSQAFVDTWTWDDAAEIGFAEIIENKSGLMTRQSVNLILMLEKILSKGSMLAYLVSMTNRIAEIYRVLKPTGSFYLHCDPTMSHYLKLVLDALFCARGGMFRNEIVWCYKERELSKKYFNRKHDIIFFYAKSKNYNFYPNRLLEPYSEGTIKKFNYTDEDGRKFQIRGKSGEYVGKQGLKIEIEKTNPDLVYRDYLDKSAGVLPRDWWQIPFLNRAAKERLGLDTQKPEALLERIILASSDEGDIVLDAYCGCGTTVAVAEKLDRNWIGIDISYQQVSLILKRLEDTFGQDFTTTTDNKELASKKLTVSGVPQDMASAVELANRKDDRLRKEFEKWAVLTYSNNRAIINDKKGGDGGVDGLAYISDLDENRKMIFREVLFSVKSSKNLSPTVIRDLYGTVGRENAAAGILITLYPMENLVKEAKKYGSYHNSMLGKTFDKIQVVTVEEILQGERLKLPVAKDVLKSAERKYKDKQIVFGE